MRMRSCVSLCLTYCGETHPPEFCVTLQTHDLQQWKVACIAPQRRPRPNYLELIVSFNTTKELP